MNWSNDLPEKQKFFRGFALLHSYYKLSAVVAAYFYCTIYLIDKAVYKHESKCVYPMDVYL